jgi:hypothetical protein
MPFRVQNDVYGYPSVMASINLGRIRAYLDFEGGRAIKLRGIFG